MRKCIALLALALLVVGSSTQSGHNRAAISPPQTTVLSLLFVGDLMAHIENIRSVPYADAFSLLAPVFESGDLAFANFEFVLDPSRPPAGYPRFNAPVDYAEAAIKAGINVVSCANNHIADLGTGGILKTIAVMKGFEKSYGIAFSGIVDDPSRRFAVTPIEIDGFRIGFLAVTAFLNRGYRTDHVNIADYRSPEDRNALLGVVREARSDFDLLVLSYHGGVEYARHPASGKVSLFEELVDAGVDILWSHHPHVLQPWELHRGEHRSGLIMYSLGNFLSAQSYHLDPSNPADGKLSRAESVVMEVEVERSGGDLVPSAPAPKATIVSVRSIPIVHLPDADGFVRVLPLSMVDKVNITPAWRALFAAQEPGKL